MPTLQDAIDLARRLHDGQVDLAGVDYIHHPLRVMRNPRLRTVEQKMVAILHDVMEDCGVTAEQLRSWGYPEDVIDALVTLTKKEEDYLLYINRVSASGLWLAITVKLSDLEDNMNLTRIVNPTSEDERRTRTYREAYEILTVRLRELEGY